MSELRKPREFWVDPDISDFLPILDTNVHYAFSDRRNPRDIHVREVLPETTSKDAEEAAEEYAIKEHNGRAISIHRCMKKSHLAGQFIGEARRTREICEWYREVMMCSITADQIEKRFLK